MVKFKHGNIWDIDLPYPTVHRYVRYNLKAKLKVPPPVSSKQNPKDIENFKKKMPELLLKPIEKLKINTDSGKKSDFGVQTK